MLHSTDYAMHQEIFLAHHVHHLTDYHKQSRYYYSPQFIDESPEIERGYLSQGGIAG